MVPDTFPSMFWGYVIVWGLLAGYIVSLGMRLRRVEKKLEEKQTEA